MFILYPFMRGGGEMSNTFFESGGKCPPLLIIRGGGQMYEGVNVLHSIKWHIKSKVNVNRKSKKNHIYYNYYILFMQKCLYKRATAIYCC